MIIGARAPLPRARWVPLAVALLATTTCRHSTPVTPEVACTTLCSRLARGCGSIDRAACEASCAQGAALSRVAGCEGAHARWVACAENAPLTCRSDLSAARVLEHAEGVHGCTTEHRDYRRCTAPCRERGIVRARTTMIDVAGERRVVHAQIVGGGCEEPKEAPKPGAPAGSPCTHHSVCAETTCACPGHGASFRARACVEGRCVEAAAACAVATAAVGHDPCRAGDGS